MIYSIINWMSYQYHSVIIEKTSCMTYLNHYHCHMVFPKGIAHVNMASTILTYHTLMASSTKVIKQPATDDSSHL